MTLIVEDGSGVANANSYVTMAFIKASIKPPRPSDDVIEAQAIKAFNLIDRFMWPGKRIRKTTWPRVLPGEKLKEKKSQALPAWLKLLQVRLVEEFLDGLTVPNDWHPALDLDDSQLPVRIFTKASRILEVADTRLVVKNKTRGKK